MQTKGMTLGPGVLYRERVKPGMAWWLVLAALVAMISIAYGAALGTTIGVAVAVVFSVAIFWGVYRASPLVVVDETGITCGAAELPSATRGAVRVVDGGELSTIARGMDPSVGDRAYSVLPAWGPRRAVVVHVEDPSDPHTAWVIATRHPNRLTAALSHSTDPRAPR